MIDANPSNFKASECLFFTDLIKQGSQFDVIHESVFRIGPCDRAYLKAACVSIDLCPVVKWSGIRMAV